MKKSLKTTMAESSSESEYYHHGRLDRRKPRTHRHHATDVTAKIHTLTSTLQDTNRNLRQVDQMLGQYRDYSNEQTEAIENLRETLEQSIGQLRSQRLFRNSEIRSASLSSLYVSDLDGPQCNSHQHFWPSSPLRDSREPQGSRLHKSRSTCVRFLDEPDDLAQLHSLHQSLRDLSNEQARLGDDLNRELSRRNRSDAQTKKTLEELSVRLDESHRQDTVSERVEKRLQEIERVMHNERQLVERRQEQLGLMSLQLQEALRKRDAEASENEELMKAKFRQSESEKIKVEQELETSRRLLAQSESSRESLLLQIEDLHAQLLTYQAPQISRQQKNQQNEHGDDRRLRRGAERSDQEKQELEKQISELKAKLNHNVMMSEVQELKRCIERKDKEKAQLEEQTEALASDLEKRERQQVRMLEQLTEIQKRYEECESERTRANSQVRELVQQAEESTKEAERYLSEFQRSEALRQDLEKKKEELRTKAQESVRQWKLKYKALERDLEKQNEAVLQLTEKNHQMLKEKDDLKGQLHLASGRIENLRQELNDIITKRANQEEELHCKERKLNDMKCQQKDLEQEVRNLRDTVHQLENELQKQSKVHNQVSTEKEHLEKEIADIKIFREKDKEKLFEFQETIKQLSSSRAELVIKMAEEERAKKEALKNLSDVRKMEGSNQEETSTVIRQLKVERDVHQKELADLRTELQSMKAKHDHNIRELKLQFKQEQSEVESLIRSLKAENLEDKNMAKIHRWQMEKIKIQCEKLAEELAHQEDENSKLKRKYHLVKQQLEDKEKELSNDEEHLRKMEETRIQLKDQLLSMETEQESIFDMLGREIDAACEIFSRDSLDKFKAISPITDMHHDVRHDPHRWLAESKTKLQWLCEEVRERENKEKKLKQQLLLYRHQLKDMTQMKESEHQSLFDQIEKQEQLLEESHRERKDLLEKNQKKDEEMEYLQGRVCALERSTRVALDHLESVPEKLSLLEDFKDFGVRKTNVSPPTDQGEGFPPGWKERSSTFQHSSCLSQADPYIKKMIPLDLISTKEDATNVIMNGIRSQARKEKLDSNKNKM
ncbi:LOW QUALITY PROTEIN: centrosomal protein of 128 kDa [Phascolarctos cinereus]|uniref:LOW QUALITY PROTEIN: centrosomal protein of 128 kDa n=1 Tax=Phascolarctos cinereus TaxID=38626 RepID=A0A6P5JCK3_PHACI|nr:LOW QUALITY PROTEIN: centrosomal protein of 128 kDa [Phascolarctos cinereus]